MLTSKKISSDADLDEYGRLLSKLNFIKTTDSIKEVIQFLWLVFLERWLGGRGCFAS